MDKSTAEIRQAFLDFFHNKKHKIVSGSSLVPLNDSTMLFTNAGMVQFKNVFLNQETLDYTCVTTCQRCVRAGGKHNDLENVGYTARHHTFFEMLGNFSFGGYFKKEAISYAWELLTDEKWFNLAPERLLVTVYENDNEAFEIWSSEIGLPHSRIIRIGDNKGRRYESDNFWQMGDIGPCGPCTEIFYDQGDNIQGGLPGSLEQGGERYIEIWNIVFIQFNRRSDGNLQLLPKPSVDTGMGLERIAAVLQHVQSTYEIDLFVKLIKSVANIVGINDLTNKSLRVIADHIRSCSFLIADGVIPSNENRGYVLRRIIRRAIRHGRMLGVKQTFFYKLVVPLIEIMGNISDNLKNQRTHIENILKNEEQKFSKTLDRGLDLLNEELGNLKNDFLDGRIVFRLYDTFGFPMDLTRDICRERNIRVDEIGFSEAMEKQRQCARKASNFCSNYKSLNGINLLSEFEGFNHLNLDTNVQAIFANNQQINQIIEGQNAIVFLNQTPFYGEKGGQIGDIGFLIGENAVFEVKNTQNYGKAIGHIGKIIKGDLRVGDYLNAKVDKVSRAYISINHSATHLLHAVLREVLGRHVVQKGSLISDKYFRFDFYHPGIIKKQEICQIEKIINTYIRDNIVVETNIMDIESARNIKAIGLFNEKYDNLVRVLKIGHVSTELCGGTHVARTGDIGLLLIKSVSSKASNVRRIEAITADHALSHVQYQSKKIQDIMQLVKTNETNLKEKVTILVDQINQSKKKIQSLIDEQAIRETNSLINKAIKIKDTKILITQVHGLNFRMLYSMTNILKTQFVSAIIVFASIIENKILLVAGVTNNLTNSIKANELINDLVIQVGGKGGGRSDIAQAIGSDLKALSSALDNVLYQVNKVIN